MLIANREQEIRYGNTITGPHRDDWQMKLDSIEARAAASRGQTRAVLLALKMTQTEILKHYRKTNPIILLDDVFAELDRHHSQALLNLIDNNQTIITATDAEYIPDEIRKKADMVDIKSSE
jgi:DNA replication and repair protein RecF